MKKINLLVMLAILATICLAFIGIDQVNGKLDVLREEWFENGARSATQDIVNQITTDLNSYGSTAIIINNVTIPLIGQPTIIQSLNNNGFFMLNALNQNNEVQQIKLVIGGE